MKGLLIGLLIGLIGGLMFAPKSGEEMREEFLEKKDGWIDALIEKLPT